MERKEDVVKVKKKKLVHVHECPRCGYKNVFSSPKCMDCLYVQCNLCGIVDKCNIKVIEKDELTYYDKLYDIEVKERVKELISSMGFSGFVNWVNSSISDEDWILDEDNNEMVDYLIVVLGWLDKGLLDKKLFVNVNEI